MNKHFSRHWKKEKRRRKKVHYKALRTTNTGLMRGQDLFHFAMGISRFPSGNLKDYGRLLKEHQGRAQGQQGPWPPWPSCNSRPTNTKVYKAHVCN